MEVVTYGKLEDLINNNLINILFIKYIMIKLNWIIILVVIVLLVFLYINNSEHFAGSLTTQNAEAVANISSMINSGNLTATNITASNTLTIPGNNKITLNAADGNKLLIDATSGKNPFFINNGIDMGCYDSWRISNNGDARFNGNTVFGSTSTFNGNVSFAGAKNTPAGTGDMRTHFPNSDGNNYIRGNTYLAGNFCIGNTCISEDHLKMLNGTKEIALKNKSTNWWIGKQSGGYIASMSSGSPRDKNNEGVDNAGAFYITNF